MRRSGLTLLVFVAVLAMLSALVYLLPLREWLSGIVDFRTRSPALAAAMYLLVCVPLLAAMLPGWIVMMLGGLVFGVAGGIALGSLAVTAGALAAFLIGRTVARDWVQGRIRGNARLEALDDALAGQAFRIVLLTRVALVLPYNLLNYVYGATRVSVPVYTLATAIGMLPAVIAYSYLGSLSADIGEVLSRERSVDGSTWLAIGVAVVAIALVVYLIRNAAAAALDKKLEETE